MPLTIFLWIMVALTSLYVALQLFFGYQVLPIIIGLIAIDIITLEINRQIDKRRILRGELASKIERVEKATSEIMQKIGNPGIDDRLTKHREETNFLLDKMARKMMDLEEELRKVGETLVSSISNLDSRLKKYESPEPYEEQMKNEADLGSVEYVIEEPQEA